jgi:hypothetical protein
MFMALSIVDLIDFFFSQDF